MKTKQGLLKIIKTRLTYSPPQRSILGGVVPDRPIDNIDVGGDDRGRIPCIQLSQCS